jgi:hypothetical protein
VNNDKRWLKARAETQRRVDKRSGAPAAVWWAFALGAFVLWLILR